VTKAKSIKTRELLIKGNIMSWEGTMIQLSNVSCISTSPLEKVEFPILSILILAVAFFYLKNKSIIGVIFLAVGLAWIYYGWYRINEKRKLETILSVSMNSGMNLRFLFSNGVFLDDVLQVLEEIIIEGDIGEQNVSINIQGCEISGNASLLNNFKLSKGGSSWE